MRRFRERPTISCAEPRGRRHSRQFNKVPGCFREITEKEFVQDTLFFSHLHASTYEFRQFYPTPVKDAKGLPLADAYLFYTPFARTGVALMDDHWAGKVRYFKFGCRPRKIDWRAMGD